MWTLVGGSGQLPLGKPWAEKKRAFSEPLPDVESKTLSLRHVSPDAVRYEMVSDPQNNGPAYRSLVSSMPLTVPLARWPSTVKFPEMFSVPRSFVRSAFTGSVPQLDSNVPLHRPVTGVWTGAGEFGDSPHAARHVTAPATSKDRYMVLRSAAQVPYRRVDDRSPVESGTERACAYSFEVRLTKPSTVLSLAIRWA